ncbi:bifunctional ADP-dependent NAD(P)H-hydrate dehydratase/NAD(P)H-hydrate epimerase [Pseudacidovorax sp. RU35E]|uniref:bifunctional ADP-dependent NAD(P)H-hydrate dehydratase/NAD(P)H-hydrate epimerase n=1 Tax=Pseudacidovorax sp. RU35E TaxID=1907403 RepID=UPI000953E212|nr:bifunctional ADP-dependent NAD(P)H-hydrate dehydratase/NAD(P)H-hydrate epimerase [Pseudacidovorax sp. RU35E]SIP99444.1 yjeF C-terminal region, hydroxyethylthiazole kinase-related/yjeF N-terminal region [Pseudacidovorax sp. RU35E]
MHRLDLTLPHLLHGIDASRHIEHAAAASLPAHTLMRRAGVATARLAMALAPHSHCIWIACGPGNNGGDGFEAALELARGGRPIVVTFEGDAARLPADARDALGRLQAAGISIAAEAPRHFDLAVDALLGLGASRAPEGRMLDHLRCMHASGAPVLAIDLPSGLNADTGRSAIDLGNAGRTQRHCLSLLTVKPGLFTAHGRDLAGTVWFDDLGADRTGTPPDARLPGRPTPALRAHDSHKGSFGDVAVIGGAPGMTGAGWLAATAALHAGAGRVFVGLLDNDAPSPAADHALMRRAPQSLALERMAVVCGCGGGTAVEGMLPEVLARARSLVLDADGLNAIAREDAWRSLLKARAQAQQVTVLTPHPLEAARLLGTDTGAVQADRLAAATQLARDLCCTVVLKGSGSVIASVDDTPSINPTGNARLATGGTGDVLAGMVGSALASGLEPHRAACEAVWWHGAAADGWPADRPFSASLLARQAGIALARPA